MRSLNKHPDQAFSPGKQRPAKRKIRVIHEQPSQVIQRGLLCFAADAKSKLWARLFCLGRSSQLVMMQAYIAVTTWSLVRFSGGEADTVQFINGSSLCVIASRYFDDFALITTRYSTHLPGLWCIKLTSSLPLRRALNHPSPLTILRPKQSPFCRPNLQRNHRLLTRFI